MIRNVVGSCLNLVKSDSKGSTLVSSFHIKDENIELGSQYSLITPDETVISIQESCEFYINASKEAIVKSAVLFDLNRNKGKCEPNLAQEKRQTKLLFKIIWVHFSVRIRVNVFKNIPFFMLRQFC